jgi:putative PIG3 family NAD(P)H quinone oxidoreductase
MQAIVIRESGGPDVLEMRDIPVPQPARGEVRVRVYATAVNRADLLQRCGLYPAPPGFPADIPGMEIAGEVVALGADVTDVAIGDRVFGIVGGGGYAEQIVVHARTLAPMPAKMAFFEAAAVPEAFITAWDALIDQCHLAAGDVLLVHAAGSGVGTAAAQIARAIGARVIGTVRTAAKADRLREMGIEESIVVAQGRFADEVLARTHGRGADVVADLVGGSYVAEDMACLAAGGRIVAIGTMGGSRCEINLSLLMSKRAEIRGTMLRARPLEEKIMAARALQRRIVPLLERQILRPVIDRVLSLAQAGEAHARLESGETFGKVVLEI